MDFFDQLEKGRYGSFELKRQVGPNLLKGLLISLLIHSTVIASPFIIARLFADDSAIPHRKYIDVTTTIEPRLVPSDPRPISSVPIKLSQPKLTQAIPVPVPPDEVDPVENLPATQIDLINHIAAQVAGDSGMADAPLAFHEPPPDTDVIPPDVFKVVEVEPQAIASNPSPEYPNLAKVAGMQGRVWIRMYVDKTGKVRDWHVQKVDPPNMGFEESVVKVIPEWKFTPAIQQGSPVGVWVSVPFNFKVK
jgi:TonB family protein